MGTYYPKAGDIKEKWYVVDAKGEIVGRLASRIASVLRGKNIATFHPAVNPQNHVIVLNADKAVLTGRKTKQKIYSRHSGYPGGLRQETAESLEKRKPGEVLRFAVKGMLPKTSLGSALLTNVRFYTDDKHPHSAQQPETITLTKARSTAGAQD
jgi:large subunit ribosomal protein L13